MKPRKLKIMGLNSYSEEQIIDFQKLTERGLFGIFGPTGSGKSSILDAITLAMYGKISRGTSEFINTSKGELHVCYEFEIGPKSSRKIYIVDRYMKRDPATGGYKTGSAVLREVDENVITILCDKARDVDNKIIEIVGLNCDDFTRSVVLPQGKFSEFLKLRGLDRRKMLERIFKLEEYGGRLTERIRNAKNEKEKIAYGLQKQLDQYIDISEERYNDKKTRLKTLLSELENLKKEKKQLEDEYQKYKTIWELKQELEGYKKKLDELNNIKEEIQQKALKLEKAKKALAVKPYIDNIEETKSKIIKCQNEIERLDKELKGSEIKLKEIEINYNKAFERKEKELPCLIEKEARLKQAIEINSEIKKLESEREGLLIKYKGIQKEIDDITREIDNAADKRKQAADSIDAAEKRISQIKIDPDFKEKVLSAAGVEKSYIELKGEIDNRKEKIEALKLEIKEIKSKYENTLKLKHEKNTFLESLEKSKQDIYQNCPGDSTILLTKKDELLEIEKKIDELKKDAARKAELELYFSEIKNKKENISKRLDDLNKYLSEKGFTLEGIIKEIEDIKLKNAAGLIASHIKEGEPCPVCGSIHHPNLAEEFDTDILEEKYNKRDNLKKDIDELAKEINALQIELAGISKEEQLKEDEIILLSKKLNEADLESLENLKNKAFIQFNLLKSSIEKWEKDKFEVENKISEAINEKALIDSNEARLFERIKKDEEFLKNMDLELQSLNDKFLQISDQYIKYKENLKIENMANELERINKFAREEDELREKIDLLRKEVSTYDNMKNSLESKKGNLEIVKAKIEESGKEKRAVIDNRRRMMDELCEGKDFVKYIEQVRKTMDEIKSVESFLKDMLEQQKNDVSKKNELKSNEEKNNKTLQELLLNQQEKLMKSLDENGFKDSSEVLCSFMDKQKMDTIENEIKSYDDSLKVITSNISRIKDKLGDNQIDEVQWNYINIKKIENEALLDEKTKLVISEQKDVETMEKILGEIKKLTVQKKQIDHELDLLDELDKLVQGNKFVEFASMSQLMYIALEASKKLREITNGRYALELDSNGEFIMRDDYNGGVRRAVDTLSGGETFLTSLCLAIALSSHIQLKGSAPLEFFFLDEGFGTLDSELLETVMSSLEKLQSDKLSIGIISHVEELKNRVPVKLIVTPAKPGLGGTKVQIEYS